MGRLTGMKPQPKILILVALASGMVASAYFIGPAPVATAVAAATRPIAEMAMAAAPSKPASTIKTLKAPVPLPVGRHEKYFDVSSLSDTVVPAKADEGQQNVPADATASDASAKASIEMDGYRNVRGLVRAADGVWHARAMRGRTEISVVVDPNGNVSQD